MNKNEHILVNNRSEFALFSLFYVEMFVLKHEKNYFEALHSILYSLNKIKGKAFYSCLLK